MSRFLPSICLLLTLLMAGCQESKTGPIATKLSDASTLPGKPAVPSATTELTVAMAADLRFVMDELEPRFREMQPEVVLKSTFGSSGSLYAQLANHAPFDVFLSADIQYPQKLADQGLTRPDSLFAYANGHIVLWVTKDSKLDVEKLGVGILSDPSVKKVAIANPKLAPYGRAAEAALKSLNVYDVIQSKLVLGENISQTAQFAETGAADAAVIAMSIALAPNFADKGKFWKIPEETYPVLKQGGVILKSSQHPEAAQKFCQFLQSPQAREIFHKYGFVLPEV